MILEPFNCFPRATVPLYHRSSVPNIKFTPAPCAEAGDQAEGHSGHSGHSLDTSQLERELESLCMSVTNKVMDKDT